MKRTRSVFVRSNDFFLLQVNQISQSTLSRTFIDYSRDDTTVRRHRRRRRYNRHRSEFVMTSKETIQILVKKKTKKNCFNSTIQYHATSTGYRVMTAVTPCRGARTFSIHQRDVLYPRRV